MQQLDIRAVDCVKRTLFQRQRIFFKHPLADERAGRNGVTQADEIDSGPDQQLRGLHAERHREVIQRRQILILIEQQFHKLLHAHHHSRSGEGRADDGAHIHIRTHSRLDAADLLQQALHRRVVFQSCAQLRSVIRVDISDITQHRRRLSRRTHAGIIRLYAQRPQCQRMQAIADPRDVALSLAVRFKQDGHACVGLLQNSFQRDVSALADPYAAIKKAGRNTVDRLKCHCRFYSFPGCHIHSS